MASRRAYVEDGEPEVSATCTFAPSISQASRGVHITLPAAVATELDVGAGLRRQRHVTTMTDGIHCNRTQKWACLWTKSVSATSGQQCVSNSISCNTAMDRDYNIRTATGTSERASDVLAQLERKRVFYAPSQY